MTKTIWDEITHIYNNLLFNRMDEQEFQDHHRRLFELYVNAGDFDAASATIENIHDENLTAALKMKLQLLGEKQQ